MEQKNKALLCQEELVTISDENWSIWLNIYATEFQKVPQDVSKEIYRFTFLWMKYEVEKQKKIDILTGKKEVPNEVLKKLFMQALKYLVKDGFIETDSFQRAKRYFKKRYVKDEVPNLEHFKMSGNEKTLVTQLLNDEELLPEKEARAVLIIIKKYRDGLIHGIKLEKDELMHQFCNFTHANSVLMDTIKLLMEGSYFPDTTPPQK